jgi:hypothetical protein
MDYFSVQVIQAYVFDFSVFGWIVGTNRRGLLITLLCIIKVSGLLRRIMA